MRDLIDQSKRIRDAAVREYRRARLTLTDRERDRETDEEVRRAVRELLIAGTMETMEGATQ